MSDQDHSPFTTPTSLAEALTVPQAVATLVKEPRIQRLVAAICGPRADAILHSADSALTERDFQATLGRQLLAELLAKTSTGLEHRVDADIESRPSCVYISNHRDVVLDTTLLNDALIAHGKPVPHVAIGVNLLETDWLVAFFRLCRAFVIQRDVTGRKLYEQSRLVSEFVRDALQRGEPVWMAQRPGRTKDGADKTEPALLRMLLMAQRPATDSPRDLYVTPVAVSYELEPCDAFKAALLIGAPIKNAAACRARRDAVHIMRGLLQQKGRIRLTIRPPVTVDLNAARTSDARKGDLIGELAQKVDQEIAAGYEIWPTNYIAYDLIHGTREYAEHYTAEERERFTDYVRLRSAEILTDSESATRALLSLYARAIECRRVSESTEASAASLD